MNITSILKFEEGFRAKPYLCSNGYVTIGYGTKLHKDRMLDPNDFELVVNETAAAEMLNIKVEEVRKQLLDSDQGEVFARLSQARQDVLVSMAYQMGVHGLLKFKKTWAHLDFNSFEAAATEMLDSKWARSDSPARARRHAEAMKENSLSSYN